MSNQVKGGIIFLALVAAGFMFYRYMTAKSDSGVDLSEPSFWVCHNEGCGKDFEIPLSVLATRKKNDDTSPLTCPHCGSAKVSRANKCPNCGRNIEFVGHGEFPENCPHCKAKIGDVPQHNVNLPKEGTAKPSGSGRSR